MAKLTARQKAGRVLSLLLGLRSPKVATALVGHGFTNADVAEGWSLLQRITRTDLGSLPSVEPVVAAVGADPVVALRAWENQWFPITKATLERRAPKVHDWMFAGSTKAARGVKAILAVGMFVARWERLDKPKNKGGFGPGGREAKTLLATRGLGASVVSDAKALIAAATALPKADEVDVRTATQEAAREAEAFEEAETALWGWYLEWSRIARTVIKDRRLLRTLGFLEGSHAKGGEEEEKEEGGTEEGAESEPEVAPKLKKSGKARAKGG